MTHTVGGRHSLAETVTIGGPSRVLDDADVAWFIYNQLVSAGLDGARVCVVVPDGTRTCPLPLLLAAVRRALHGRVARLTVLIALGTHAAMSREPEAAHLGFEPGTATGQLPGHDDP